MNIRRLQLKSDLERILMLWQEVGWISPDKKSALKLLFESGDGYGAEMDSELEATLLSLPADINYNNKLLSLQALSGLVVSPRARRRGIAGRLMTRALEEGVRSGQALSALVMFEQGFYDSLGFGLGGYKHIFTFDPDLLEVDADPEPPERLTAEDWQSVYQALQERKRANGGVNIKNPHFIKAEMEWDKNDDYGLGYRDEEGDISHFVWLWRKGDSHGPLQVKFLAYQTQEQLLELLAVIARLGDQVHAVRMDEPHSIKLRDFIVYPHKQARITAESKYSYASTVQAPWQLKILDLEKCVSAFDLAGIDLEFNLELHDPLAEYADSESPAVISGEYSLKLGEESCLKSEPVKRLPTLTASINAFTRMYLGAATPTELKTSSLFSAPPELLQDLEETFVQLPEPQLEMYF